MTFSPFHRRVTFLKILLLRFVLQRSKFAFPLQHGEPQGSARHWILLPMRFKVVKRQVLLPGGWSPPLSLIPLFLFAAVCGCVPPPTYAIRLHQRRLFEQGVPLRYLLVISLLSPAADSHHSVFLLSCSLLLGACSDSFLERRSSAATCPQLKLIFMSM